MFDKIVEIITMKKDLIDILTPYGVGNSTELLNKFNQHLGNDHPIYEDYLAAKQIESDLKDCVSNMKDILEDLVS
jgi:hypothetical protein